MQVTSGAEWHTDKGDKRSYSVSLNEDDVAEMTKDEDFKTKSFNDRRKIMNNACDALVVIYLCKERVVDKNYAERRMAELRSEISGTSN